MEHASVKWMVYRGEVPVPRPGAVNMNLPVLLKNQPLECLFLPLKMQCVQSAFPFHHTKVPRRAFLPQAVGLLASSYRKRMCFEDK